jgi:hypothetical protein
MIVIETTAHIGADGMLRLAVFVGLPEQDVHVVLVIHPQSSTSIPPAEGECRPVKPIDLPGPPG